MAWYDKLNTDFFDPDIGTPPSITTILQGSPVGLLLTLTYAEDITTTTGGTGIYWQHANNTEWQEENN